MSENKVVLYTLLAVAVLSSLYAGYQTSNIDVQVPEIKVPSAEVTLPSGFEQSIADAVVAKIPAPSNVANGSPASINVEPVVAKDKEDLREDKALELAISETESSSFKKALREAINRELSLSNISSSVESYKDIRSVRIDDAEADLSGKSADVELAVTVKYLLDSDTDDDDVEKVKFTCELDVNDLDEREDFIDAEVEDVDSSDCTLVKFYEN